MRCTCPECSAAGIPLHERMGWNFRPVTCRACGARFAVPGWARLTVVGLALVISVLAIVLRPTLSEHLGAGLASVLWIVGGVVAILVALSAVFAAAPLSGRQE